MKRLVKNPYTWLALSVAYLLAVVIFGFFHIPIMPLDIQTMVKDIAISSVPPLDKADYDRRLALLAHIPLTATSTATTSSRIASSSAPLWPVHAAYPADGAILPFHRIVAYYGNFYSKQMGVLGQYPEDEVLSRLQAEVDKWNAADPATPVMPAIHYIAVTAQGYPGDDKKYRLRMPNDQIDHALAMAKKIHGIVFLDVQVGASDVQTEIPLLKQYLELPEVHLGIDPEFSMKLGGKPGTVIGTLDAADINFVISYLSGLVTEKKLTPKILIIHRFTQAMLTHATAITPTPQVQVVINMDGWGTAPRKINTYKSFISTEPVQFTGFKLFYKNDTLTASTTVMQPASLLELTPAPIYIQYQ